MATLRVVLLLTMLAWCVFPYSLFAAEEADPYLFCEEIDRPDVIDWVKKENTLTMKALQLDPRYTEYNQFILEQLNAKDRLVIPSIYRNTDVILNFWRDANHPQGIVRQSTLDKFLDGDPGWKTVVDLDALSKAEGKTLVYSGTARYFHDYRKVMIGLSDGGKDAAEYREFDYETAEFVKDGFFLKESKSGMVWFDEDTLLVSSAMTEEDRTESGYPRVVRLWRRGTPFEEAPEVFSCAKDELAVGAGVYRADGDQPVFIMSRQLDFFNNRNYLYRDGTLDEILIPTDASLFGFYKGQAVVWLKSDWETGGKTYPQDSIIYFPRSQMTSEAKDISVLYEPAPNRSFQDVDITDEYLYLTYLEDVRVRVEQRKLDGTVWMVRRLPLNELETASLVVTPRTKGFVLYIQSGFNRPSTLYMLDERTFKKRELQSLPHRFSSDGYVVKQEFATSPDGTRIPYFVVHKKGLELNGDNPVLQYGYGGFLVPLLPGYLPVEEHCWLREGGVYVLTNIRGGGEYGPAWHKQALKRNRRKAFEDFIAVSEDLIAKGYTNPSRLGIEGGSNGGLLTGAVMTMRPDLYNAVVISVPLLDMLRFHKLPPGASWMGEYGDPDDPGDREAIRAYSPYHNLCQGTSYPPPFIMTSTKDDRVHPGHARKFVKKMQALGRTVYYYEEMEGGHSGNANSTLSAKRKALMWVYLHQRLMDGKPDKAREAREEKQPDSLQP